MDRFAWLCSLALLTGLLLTPARGDRPTLNKDAQVLQEAMQDAIEVAEPAVACLLVSRSDRYKEFDAAPSEEQPGILGEFHYDYSNVVTEKSPRYLLARKLDLANAETVPESFGSGVVIDDKERLVLTNYHVVREATKVYVRLPEGWGSYANIFAADPRSDLAVLQLIRKPKPPEEKPLKAIRIGNAARVRKGQLILAITNPYAAGFKDGSPSASWGIISNIRQRAPRKERLEAPKEELTEARLTLHHYGTLLQTDTRLNLGCSGGALIDLHGDLIGLTTSLAAVSGSDNPGGYAVPIDDTMRRIIETLRQGKEVEYGFLGVSFNPSIPNRPVQLNRVYPGSPAWKAGLRDEDVIKEVNGTPILSTEDMFLPLAKLPPGAAVTIKATRFNQALEFRPVLAKYSVPGKIIAQNRREFRGLRVDYTSLLIQPPFRTDLERVPAGVFVREVRATTAAARAGINVGNVITEVNGRRVDNPDQFYQAVKDLKGPVELTLGSAEPTKVTIN